jgi:hypothetical protein
MTEQNQPPINDQQDALPPNLPPEDFEDNFIENPADESAEVIQPAASAATSPQNGAAGRPQTPESDGAAKAAARLSPDAPAEDARMGQRLERLGGEPAPVITPEEFARLQKAGQVHIDERGRVRTARPASDANVGVSLRKRRAWYVRD